MISQSLIVLIHLIVRPKRFRLSFCAAVPYIWNIFEDKHQNSMCLRWLLNSPHLRSLVACQGEILEMLCSSNLHT